VLSLRCVMPTMPMVAALSAAHLAAILLPDTLRRLYIAGDNDPAGHANAETLAARAIAQNINPILLRSRLGDFNEDVQAFGLDSLRADIRCQIMPEDVARFMTLTA
ncbi:MAG: toprim domain-containing protein, partial [Acidiphilium sp.]